MAEPREAPWPEIRELYETTDAGLQWLSDRYGFASKTTIKRRRDAEGWVKDPEVVRANLATRAARGTVLGEGIVPPVPPGGTPGGYTQPQQNKASAAPNAVGVPPEGQDQRSLTPIPRAELSRVSMSDRVEWLAEMRARSERNTLELAQQMQRTGSKLMALVEAIADGPALHGGDPDEATPGNSFGLARIALTAVNPDKDKFADSAKQAVAMIATGIKLEREILGLEQSADAPGAAAGSPSSPVFSPEQLIREVGADLELLRHLAMTNRKVQQLRPDIEGEAERIP